MKHAMPRMNIACVEMALAWRKTIFRQLGKGNERFQPKYALPETNSTKFFITKRKKKKSNKIMKSFFHYFGNCLSVSNTFQLSESSSQIWENSFLVEWLYLKSSWRSSDWNLLFFCALEESQSLFVYSENLIRVG